MLADEATYQNGRRIHLGEIQPTPQSESLAIATPFTWVGLVEPTLSELQLYQHRFHLNDLAVEDALSSSQRPKLDIYHQHLCLHAKTVAYDKAEKCIVVGNITIFLAENFVVTVRHGDAIPLHTIRADLENHPDRLKNGPTAVLHEIVDRLVDQYTEVCAHLESSLDELEDMVFDDEIPAPAAMLYAVKRELINFRRSVIPLVQPLEKLSTGSVQFIDSESAPLFSDVLDHLRRVIDSVESMNELMTAALNANLTLIQVQQNTDMRRISAWVAIGAVPTMVAGIYGMNFKHMPELDTRFGYFGVLGALAATCISLFLLFRKYEWL